MNIEAKGLTKIYGQQKALENVSFTINNNEIVGLIGPNGAGKSTLMKILTCFIPQTEGTANVCGYDINEYPIEVRRQIGYLPESNPLYCDMYVKEYLMFTGHIHKIKNLEKEANAIIDLIGLNVEKNKKIGALSKGYKQRVGLAQAMIHNPKILILDEPTSGLDPNQIIEIRNLIVKIGKEKTVLLSTHNMHEVETVCDKIILINKGKLIANTKTSNLNASNSSLSIILVEFDKNANLEKLKQIKGITEIISLKENKYKIVSNQPDIRSDIFDFAVNNNMKVLALNVEKQDLEALFHSLTKQN